MATTEREMVRAEIEAASKELASQPRSRKELVESFQAFVLRSAVEESKEADSVDDLRRWTEVSSLALTLLRRGSDDFLTLMLEALREVDEDDDEADDARLDDWGRLQVHATYERARRDSYTVRWLENHGISRQRLNQWRQRGYLIGIPDLPGVKGYAYPRWQFTDALRPKSWLPEVIEAAAEARLDPLGLHLFMTNEEAGQHGSPLEAADSGDLETAAKLVAAANAQGN